jgi:hypothetical protein
MVADPSYFARLWEFLWEVLSAWLVQVTGVILVIEQFLEFILPRKLWEKVDAKVPKPERRRLLLWLCALAFIYASFSAYDDVNKRLRLAYELKPSAPFDVPALPSSIKRLRPEQAKTISTLIAENRQKIGTLYFARYLHQDTIVYSGDILDAINRSGVEVMQDIIAPDSPDQTGVMVACDDPKTLPENAKILMDIFRRADIEITTTKMLMQAKKKGVASGCILFIGPDPL